MELADLIGRAFRKNDFRSIYVENIILGKFSKYLSTLVPKDLLAKWSVWKQYIVCGGQYEVNTYIMWCVS